MKIAITSNGERPEQPVETRFGRCNFFIIYDTEINNIISVANEAKDASSGAGVKAAQKLIDLEVDLLITGSVGPGALEILNEGDIKVTSWTLGSVGEAIEKFGKATEQ